MTYHVQPIIISIKNIIVGENMCVDYENFISSIYTPLKSISSMADVIYYKCNNDWVFFDASYSDCEELLSFVFSIKILTDYIMHLRNNALDSFQEFNR